MFLLRTFDAFLNRLTMYRVLVYSLSILLAGGGLLSYLGLTSFSLTSLAWSVGLLSVACFSANRLLAFIFRVPANFESGIITTLILVCIMQPPETVARGWAIVLVGILAMAAKYIFVLHKQHIFNPAAIAAFIVSAAGLLPATWWIATAPLVPITILLGVCVLRKTRHFSLFGIFAAAALATMLIIGVIHGEAPLEIARLSLVSWPILFFGTMMLTEPHTMPADKSSQGVFAALVGVLFASQLNFGPVSASPQLALIIGNVFAFALNPRGRFVLQLKAKREIAPNIYDFAFIQKEGNKSQIRFTPGQFLDWTLPHVGLNSRGNRRTFTIASSPTEPALHLGVKFYEPSSAYKVALRKMRVGDTIMTSRLSGDFVMPRDSRQKLVFIAGGIGITPFRSMARYLVDSGEHRDITLYHLITTAADAVYQQELTRAKKIGWKTHYVVREGKVPTGSTGTVGELTPELLAEHHPDLKGYRFYISGPPAMVDHYVALLKQAGCKRAQIVTDFFSGY